MNYEQKYKEAIKRAKAIYQGSYKPDTAATIAETLQNVFPELKENEDEKIRKAILDYLTKMWGNCQDDVCGVHVEDAIAWLEKQGEQKPTDTCDSLIIKSKEFPASEKRDFGYFNEPTDNIEPKFKVGDWVVQENIGVYKVIEVCESWYEVVDNKDKHYSIGFDKEYMCHLYTIEDAKTGDVLVTPLPKGCEAGEQIFVFKGINSRDYVDNCIEYYCRICQGVFYENEIGYMGTTSETFYPATKEQRDTLMKAMADAGYTFDFEKKELKKIEEKHAENKGMNLVEEEMTPFQKKVFSIIDNAIEEEQGLKQVCDELFTLASNEIKQKPDEWSEEDEDIRDTIIRDLKRLGGDIVNVKTAYKAEIDWLKSLEQRIGWKPTKEQMEALHDLNLTGNISYAGQGQVLIELYNDLKKL